ncbi:MAG: lipoyl(octanoyl) transferase [Bacillota bacterium]|jgi:lipoate-protein ligase B|nr:lipoyl(octanoyl) transferase [Bacillota bacterium]MDK2960791.1 lipoyl(octanoyl) transferase [Bacillota bacterium]
MHSKVVWLGRQEYGVVLARQKELVQKVRRGAEPDTLLLVEHEPVITLGRTAKKEHLLLSEAALKERGISLFSVERGGDVTYHGPGQLVGYPILDLNRYGRDLHLLLRNYEEVLIRTLADFGVAARRFPPYTGVWVGEEKVAAIGVAVESWVCFHGFAFNVDPNLDHFRLIVPCGISEYGVTSLARLLRRPVGLMEVIPHVIRHFADVFGLTFGPVEKELLGESER